jgi:hydroxymethylpyrimidine/phosphomethylpyrimidine kinase
MARAARDLSAVGPRIVVVKGGHLQGDHAVDVVYTDGALRNLDASRVDTGNVHGTGCTFASAIAARLALGDQPLAAIEHAKQYITAALRAGAAWRLGSGHGPVDHFAVPIKEAGT